MKITNENHNLYYTWLKVLHMLEQPTALFHPKFIVQVLQQIVKEKFSTAETHYEQIPTVISKSTNKIPVEQFLRSLKS